MGHIVISAAPSRGITAFVFWLLMAGFILFSSAAQAAGALEQEFIYRVSFGRSDDVKLLISKGADVNATNDQGWPMLAVAADRVDREALPIVQLLVEAGAAINKADKKNHYPLINAIHKENAPIVEYLLDHGAEVTVRDQEGYDARTIAAQLENGDILKLVDAKIERDQEELAKRKSPQNLNRLIREFATGHCESQYWAYFMASKQDPSRDAEIEAKLDQIEASTTAVQREIGELFNAKEEDFNTIATNTRRAVFNELEQLVSNRNRKAHGVGTLDDADRRCRRLANSWAAQYTASPR